VVYRNFLIFLHNALVIVPMVSLLGAPLTWTALLAIPAVLLYLPFGLFAGLALGPICARFRDLPQLIVSAMQIVFFLTPIFWSPKALTSRHIVVAANPFYHLVEIMRAPLTGHLPTLQNWAVSLATLAVLGVFAWISLAASRRQVYLWL
jgi:homopolymeric O-antigen transport system permease protein